VKLVKQTTLYLKDDRSDKVYEVDLCETPGGEFLVNFRYGRRGANLREGTKTTTPVDRKAADEIFDKLVTSKTKKGYCESQPSAVGTEAVESPVATDAGASESRKQAILARLTKGATKTRGEWSISRAVWRAGEL
jgi:predicted DNA-binding WGR domain protein